MGIDYKKWGIFGAVASIVTVPLLMIISKFFSLIPGVTVDLHAISLTADVSGAFQTGLGQYAQRLLGVLPIGGLEIVYTVIGGALFVILGAFIVDKAGYLTGSKQKRVTTVLVVAGLITGAILSWKITLPTISGVIIMLVDAFVLSFILVKADDAVFNGKLVP